MLQKRQMGFPFISFLMHPTALMAISGNEIDCGSKYVIPTILLSNQIINDRIILRKIYFLFFGFSNAKAVFILLSITYICIL
jgi:hypothetical protein